MQKYAKNMQLYARYANMIFICKICTPHFADVVTLWYPLQKKIPAGGNHAKPFGWAVSELCIGQRQKWLNLGRNPDV